MVNYSSIFPFSYPLPVNMVVVLNKPKIREKSVDLLNESSENCLKYRKYVTIETHKEG